jgi:hypothetical protein
MHTCRITNIAIHLVKPPVPSANTFLIVNVYHVKQDISAMRLVTYLVNARLEPIVLLEVQSAYPVKQENIRLSMARLHVLHVGWDLTVTTNLRHAPIAMRMSILMQKTRPVSNVTQLLLVLQERF